MWINISKSGNSFMTGWELIPPERKKKENEEVFSQGILRENRQRVAVDVFIYVFVNEAT